MAEKIRLTQQGVEKYQTELDKLKNEDRPNNIKAIQDARAQGDLSENADYAAAREEQARIDARIREIENILKNCELIQEVESNDYVTLTKYVTIQYLSNKKEVEYQVLGTKEANPLDGKNPSISDTSPLGSALIGRKVGDIATYNVNDRLHEVKILNISNVATKATNN